MNRISLCVLLALSSACAAGRAPAVPAAAAPSAATSTASTASAPTATAIPRTADGRPNLHGIWQVRNRAAYSLVASAASDRLPASHGVVENNGIPYQAWAAAKQRENFQKRVTADPLAGCFLPGVPRIMYMDWPFQIFQTPQAIGITFEWTQVFRLIHTDGSKHVQGIEFWMGDSRGRWEGDTLVVNVANFNDRSWLDASGNFHSEAMTLVERYTMLDANRIQYEVTVEDPKVFTRPWKMAMQLHRHTEIDRLLEYQCKAEQSEASGAFERDPKTWYPGPELKSPEVKK